MPDLEEVSSTQERVERDPGALRKAKRSRLTGATLLAVRLLKLTWAQVILVFLAGVLLTFVPEMGWTGPIHHIGIGLLVAAVVTSFWHLREFSEFFEKFSSAILVKDEYLAKLSFRALADLRSRAARAILESCVDNPSYKHHELGEWIDGVLFEDLLPGRAPRSGIYRKRYKEDVSFQFLTLKEALEDVGSPTEGITESDLQARVIKIISISRFTAISPKLDSKDYAAYETSFSGRTADLPNFPLKHRIVLHVGHNETDAEPVTVNVVNEREGGISFQAKTKELDFTAGECEVWMRSTEFQSPKSQTHVLNMMGILTHGLEVKLHHIGAGASLTFEGDVIATGSGARKLHLPGGVELIYDGWLFEGHGYFLWWWEK